MIISIVLVLNHQYRYGMAESGLYTHGCATCSVVFPENGFLPPAFESPDKGGK